MPFGGMYRIIDFTLSNAINSGFRKIFVLTQYKSVSLDRHIQLGWAPMLSAELEHWVQSVPPQLRVGQRWYEGTADAVYQNIYLIGKVRPKRVIVLSGDHVYKMDYARMVGSHRASGATATVAAIEVPREQASAFGVLEVDENHHVVAFHEKPADPLPVPGKPDRALVNMGVYCFETEPLVEALLRDAESADTRHDFGRDILPALAARGELLAFPFEDLNRKPEPYWRDIGTLDSYYEASMDLVSVDPVFNLYDLDWPLRTLPRQLPPAKFVFGQETPEGRLGRRFRLHRLQRRHRLRRPGRAFHRRSRRPGQLESEGLRLGAHGRRRCRPRCEGHGGDHRQGSADPAGLRGRRGPRRRRPALSRSPRTASSSSPRGWRSDGHRRRNGERRPIIDLALAAAFPIAE